MILNYLLTYSVIQHRGVQLSLMHPFNNCSRMESSYKQVGLAAGSKCLLSHMGFLGLIQNRHLCWMIMHPSINLVGHFSDVLSVIVSVRSEPHNGYVTERVQSSVA